MSYTYCVKIVGLLVASLLLLAAALPLSSSCEHGPCAHGALAVDHHHAHASGCASSHAERQTTACGGHHEHHDLGAENSPLVPVDSCGSCGAPGCGCGPDAGDSIETSAASVVLAAVDAPATGEVCATAAWNAPAAPKEPVAPLRVGIVVLRT